MADFNVTRFIIDGKTFVIPTSGQNQTGLMSAEDYNKLAGIAAGAQVNVIEGVKVNGVALGIAEKIVDILIATGATNGTLSVNGADIAVKGLAALAYKAEVSEAELSAALKAVIDAKAEQTDVDALSGKIDVLNGTGAGSVTKAINDAFNDFATKVTDDGVVNSYKELIDWAASHGAEAAEMAAAIQTLEGLLDGIGGADEPATVQAAITTAVNNAVAAINISNYYTKSEADAKFDTKVDKVEGYGLSKNDFTDALKSKLDGIAEKATANTYSYEAATETLTLTGFTPAV